MLATLLCMLFPGPGNASAGGPTIEDLHSLELSSSQVKSIREDVRRGIFIVKSRKEAALLPELRFYRYRVRRGENFWIVLTRTSLDMDTLMTVNSLSSPGEVEPGRILFIPNMRGVIHRSGNDETAGTIAAKYQVGRSYISALNANADPPGEYLFIPCGAVSNLERSLFLGTGFSNPLRMGRLTSGFGMRKDPFSERFKFHRGIDIACRPGSRVHAARDGKVVFTGYKGGYGLLMVVRHAHMYFSYYGHLSKILRKEGESINTGDLIALSGNTGLTTGQHLHFEVHRGSAAVNPGILLR
jgi:murein DD-endopeptidase MepM/ murein hydrolase activator NlpD